MAGPPPRLEAAVRYRLSGGPSCQRWLLRVEGQKRTLTGPFALAFSLTAAGFSLCYLYTSGFGLVSTETTAASA